MDKELIFWVGLLIVCIGSVVWMLTKSEKSLYISGYSLDRMNGYKY